MALKLNPKKVSLSFLILLLLFTGAILLFSYLMHEVLFEHEVAADNSILHYLSAHVVNERLTRVMKAVTFFASSTALQAGFTVLVLVHVFLKKYLRAFEAAAVGIGGYLLNYVMKLSFHRQRPPDPLIGPLHNFSFPSGHATSGFIFYGLLAFLIWQTRLAKPYRILIGTVLVLFSLLIGFSRVYLHVHYPSDVLAGFCVGFAWLMLAIWVMERSRKRGERRRAARSSRPGSGDAER